MHRFCSLFFYLSGRYYYRCTTENDAQLNRESRNEFGIDSETSGWSLRPHEGTKDFVGSIPSASDKRNGTFSICAKLELRNLSAKGLRHLRKWEEKEKISRKIYRCYKRDVRSMISLTIEEKGGNV